MSVQDNLKSFRKKANLTQKELADKLNVSVNTIQNYENGRRTPKLEVLYEISKILGINISDLINLNDFNDSRLKFIHPEEEQGFYFRFKFSDGDNIEDQPIAYKKDFLYLLKYELRDVKDIEDFFKLTLSWLPWDDLDGMESESINDLIKSLALMYKFKLFEFSTNGNNNGNI